MLPPNRERDCYLTRPESPICTIAGFSTGSDSASNALLYHAPIGIKVFDFHRTREDEQRIKRSKQFTVFSSLLVFTSHPCPRLRTQKMTGSRPCPREGDNSHGFWVPAFQWLTAWSVKMEISDQRGVERVSNQHWWVGPAKNRVPRSSPSLKRTFSPPGKRHDLS